MGRAFVIGDDIDTDVLAPGAYLMLDAEDMARHCLESVRPDFADAVRPGDVLVAGANFGLGSAREQAPGALKVLGVSVVLAKSFARIFYRNAFNIGLPLLELPEGFDITDGDEVSVDAGSGLIVNHTQETRRETNALPPHLKAMVDDGGLIAHLKKRQARALGSD